ncbi:MAG TPA: ATP-binding protein [Anaerolineales bacterium]|nr:ATP-binding protein [Anaerolineales bacterium]
MDEKTIPLPRLHVKSTTTFAASENGWDEHLYGRELFEQSGECIFIIGMDLRYIAVNGRALSLLGYEENELIGKPVSDVMSQDQALGQGSVVGNHTNLHERILKRKDGSLLPVEVSTSIVYQDGLTPAYIQSIARDISDRKAADNTLRRHARILSVINDAAAILLRSSDIEVKIPEVLKLLGNAMDVSYCAIFEVNNYADKPLSEPRYVWNKTNTSNVNVFAVVEPHLSEIWDLRNGTEEQPASFSQPTFVSVPIGNNPNSRFFLIFFDDSREILWSPSEFDAAQTAANLIESALQRNRFEETIRLNEARNRIVLDALPDLLIRLDRDGVILDYSAKPDHPLHIHRDVISGRKLSQVWPDEIVAKIIGDENVTFFESAHWLAEFNLPYSNSTYESRLYPIDNDEALIVVRDVTELAVLNEMKSDFINRASHELRTPITTVMLMAELIQEGGTPEELEEYWRTLKSELNRQKILIDRLLIAGRLESGMMNMEAAKIDLIPILEESIRAIKPVATKRGVDLCFANYETSLCVLGEKSGLQQVFINLINNAAKFSPKGSSVNIEVSHTKENVSVEIRDSGVGIPQDAIPYLFEKFYRAKNVTIAEIPGSGIGLYIVKTIVDELGGNINVTSEMNKGTTFTVTLRRVD